MEQATAAPNDRAAPASGKPRLRRTSEQVHADTLKIVAGHGGQCLDLVFKNQESHMTVRCAEGHVWRTRVKAILYGSWCPQCAAARIVESARALHGTLDLGDIDEIAVWAEAQGLEFVEGDPPPQGRTDFFRCDAGHLWEVSRRSPVGAWCPACGTRGTAMGVGRVAP
jgi:hypothetical protein